MYVLAGFIPAKQILSLMPNPILRELGRGEDFCV
jgi:hypothetical protein